MTLNLSNLCKYCGIFAFAILVSLPAAMAATPDEYEARISADKRDVAAYIGLLDAQIAAGQQKMAQTTQKRALRYAKAKSQKLGCEHRGLKFGAFRVIVKRRCESIGVGSRSRLRIRKRIYTWLWRESTSIYGCLKRRKRCCVCPWMPMP